MTLTVTLTPALIAGIVYTVIALIITAVIAADEMTHVNSKYYQAIIFGAFWPMIIVNLVMYKLTGTSIYDIYRAIV